MKAVLRLTTFLFGVSLAFAETEKRLNIPEQVWKVPDHNDYEDPASEFSLARMAQSQNCAIFWSKEYGLDPTNDSDPDKRLPIPEILKESERFYDIYANKLKFAGGQGSVLNDSKLLIYIVGGNEGTAFGGGSEKVGILWAPRARIQALPFGALAHELGHSFQFLVHADGAWGFTSAPEGSRGQTIFEMTSQFMLWQVYPDWMTFENYHLESFMKKTHFAFLHETNQYHSPYVLEYWATRHGHDFIGRLWREAKEGEDPVLAYQRITKTDQNTFNDEIFDAARRFITWDMKRIANVAARYANQHESEFTVQPGAWFRIAESRCPQNYGYNGIRLTVPPAGTHVRLEFRGIAGVEGYRSIRIEDAGWRYGFLAVRNNGTRVYGKTFHAPHGSAGFTVPTDTGYLWLVVSGAPANHWIHLNDEKPENDEQWPYEIRLTGATLDPSIIR
jgi:hypothetical protein